MAGNVASKRQGPALGVALVLAVLACSQEPVVQEAVVRPVKLHRIDGPATARAREYPGEIRAIRQADMAFEVPGRVVEFPVDEGQVVRAGTVLARLDPRDYQQELEKATAVLRQSKTDLERYKYLYEQGVNPKRDYELRQRSYEVSQADHAIAKKALDDTVLRAPFDGVVARKLVEDYVNVQAKEPVLLLQDDSRLRIRVSVPERDLVGPRGSQSLDELSERLSPQVILSSRPDRSFPARFSELSTTADPATRTYQATLTFAPPDDVTVLPGMTAKVRIEVPGVATASRAPLRIPSVAVVAGADGPFVWVVDEDMTVRKVPVEVGPLTGAEIEIRTGLATGQVVATSGVHQLEDGMSVRRYQP